MGNQPFTNNNLRSKVRFGTWHLLSWSEVNFLCNIFSYFLSSLLRIDSAYIMARKDGKAQNLARGDLTMY